MSRTFRQVRGTDLKEKDMRKQNFCTCGYCQDSTQHKHRRADVLQDEESEFYWATPTLRCIRYK